ncbi:MAG: hypothetical protein ACJ8EF_09825 [Bradyrhizobium sp.]|jgi:hypothetical protein
MSVSNESLDPRGMTPAPTTGVNPAKLFFRWQASMLRIWAMNCDLAADMFGKRLETIRPAPEQHREAA